MTPLPDEREALKELLKNPKWGVSMFAGHRDVLIDNLVEFIATTQSDLLRKIEGQAEIFPERGIGSIQPVRAVRLAVIEKLQKEIES